MSFRRRFFDRAYRRGHPRWDSGEAPPEVVAFIEGGPTPGRALDLGCGTGTNALYLAGQGWQVVGIDFAELAIEAAQAKLAATTLSGVIFLRGDVSELATTGVEGSFDFALDIGCFHGLPKMKREPYVRELAAYLRPGAALLMFAFGASWRRPGKHRTREAEIRHRFTPRFTLESVELGADPPGAAWFTLRRAT